jgi:hypothetical protein
MNLMKKAILPALVVVMTSGSLLAAGSMSAQAQVFRRAPINRDYSNRVERAVERVESNASVLQREVDNRLDRSRLDGTNREDNVNEIFKDLRDAAREVRERVDDGDRPEGSLRRLMDSWRRAEAFINRYPNISRNVQRDIQAMRTSMSQLQDAVNDRRGF